MKSKKVMYFLGYGIYLVSVLSLLKLIGAKPALCIVGAIFGFNLVGESAR